MRLESVVSILLVSLISTYADFGVKAQSLYPKEVLAKNFQYDPFYNKFKNLSLPVKSNHSTWRDGHFPEACVNEAKRVDCPVNKMKAYTVRYADCPQPWNFCRCGDAPMSLESMIDIFSRVPVKLRSYVRHFMSFPFSPKLGFLAYAIGPDFAALSNLALTTMFHELGHVYDLGKSGSEEWKNSVKNDTCVITPYSNTSPAENLAETVSLVYLEMVDPAGFKQLGSKLDNFKCMSRQLDFTRRTYKDILKAGGMCPKRQHPDSKDVSVKITRRDVELDAEARENGWSATFEPISLGERSAKRARI